MTTKQTLISGERKAEIIATLNEYEERLLAAPLDEYDEDTVPQQRVLGWQQNVWQDVIYPLPELDHAATEALYWSCCDALALCDGSVVYWDDRGQRWDESPFSAQQIIAERKAECDD